MVRALPGEIFKEIPWTDSAPLKSLASRLNKKSMGRTRHVRKTFFKKNKVSSLASREQIAKRRA